MEYFINEVGQVMQKTVNETFIETKHYGMEKQYKSMELVDRTIYQWYKFDLTQKKYLVDSSNTTPIVIDGVSRTPVNGTVEVIKQTIMEPETNDEIANLYEAVVVLDDRITNLERGNE